MDPAVLESNCDPELRDPPRSMEHHPVGRASEAPAGVSVVIPAYNERNGRAPTIERRLDALDRMQAKVAAEVIVVDDGSDDGTEDVGRGLADPRVRVLRHERNRGYGAAIKTGMRHARYEWIAISDADGTYPPESLAALLEKCETNDMVVGARTGAVSQIPLMRRAPKWVLRRLASYLIRRDIPDLNSGFRLIRREHFERYAHLLPDQFSLTTTITLALLADGYAVEYLPIDYFKRQGRSKIRPIADTLSFVTLIIRTILYFNPLRVFLPTSLLFMVASVGVGVGSILFLDRFMDVTTVLLFVTSVQLLALGMLADVINRRSR